MGNENEPRLRGNKLDNSDQKTDGNPDTELHLDDEKDTLYDDGIDVEDESETLAGTHGMKNNG